MISPASTELEAAELSSRGGRLPAIRRVLAAIGSARPVAGDVSSVALLIAAVWWLAARFGGWERSDFLAPAALALVAVPAAAYEARRLSGLAKGVIGMWGFGALASLVFGVVRSGFIDAVLVIGFLPVVGLCLLRIWRRAWGPSILAATLLAAFGTYWQRGFLQWWGYTLRGDPPTWLALGWHNQSATLMAAFALLFLGIAVCTRPQVAVAAAACSGAAIAGAGLAGSRGGVVSLAIGVIVTVVAGWRHVGVRRTAVAVAATMAIALAIGSGLTAMTGSGGSSLGALAEREQSAALHLTLRLQHMEAAAGMVRERSVVGFGPGSYGSAALDYTRPSANLTASAHNEFLRAFAEGGIVTGLPLAGLLIAGLVLSWQVMRRRPAVLAVRQPGPALPDGALSSVSLTSGVRVGAAGAFVALSVHAATDFDWDFPALAALWMIALALLWATRAQRGESDSPSGFGFPVVVPAALLLVVGLLGAQVERAHRAGSSRTSEQPELAVAGWDAPRLYGIALTFSQEGHVAQAAAAADRALRWNPGEEELRALRDVIAFQEGAIPAEVLRARIPDDTHRFHQYNVVAEALIMADRSDLAIDALSEAVSRYPTYAAWGIRVRGPALASWHLLVQAELDENGCGAAAAVVSRALEDRLMRSVRDVEEHLSAVTAEACE